jgi:tol-pal system protein YbgF
VLVARMFERYTHVKNLHLAAAAAILASGCSTLSPTADPTALRMTDIEARLIRIERVVENQSLVQLASELEGLRAESAALRGQIETLRFESENSDTRQRELYVDVDRRLQSLETAPRAFEAPPSAPSSSPSFGAPSAAPPVAAARPAGSDQQNYDAAFALLQGRKYAEAAAAFETFLTQFPTSPRADNAVYWLAETYYVRGEYGDALPVFRRVTEQYPQSDKVPDALLKVGFSQIELGDNNAARQSLQEVMRQFPDTTAARLASQRLDRLSQ